MASTQSGFQNRAPAHPPGPGPPSAARELRCVCGGAVSRTSVARVHAGVRVVSVWLQEGVCLRVCVGVPAHDVCSRLMSVSSLGVGAAVSILERVRETEECALCGAREREAVRESSGACSFLPPP